MRRRSFLKAASIPILGSSRLLLGASSRMFISLNGSLVGSRTGPDGRRAPVVEWPEFARLAARIGYGGVDVNLSAAMAEGLETTRALFSELKIKPGICGFPAPVFGKDESEFQTGLAKLPDAAKFVAAIGCPRMMAVLPPSSETPKIELRKIYRDRLAAVSETLLRSKVRLGMEFLGPMYMHTRLPYEFIWHMDEALEFAKECGPNIGLVLDAWHWYHAHATIDDILHAGKSRIVTVHVSDARKQPRRSARQPAALARRRSYQSGGVLPGASKDWIPGRRESGTARPNSAGHVP